MKIMATALVIALSLVMGMFLTPVQNVVGDGEVGKPVDRGDGTLETIGDWTIIDSPGPPIEYRNATIIVNGNLIIETNAVLVLDNVTLILNNSNYQCSCGIEVAGGLDILNGSEIILKNMNNEPLITSTPITTATEDVHYTYNVNATDIDAGDRLTYSLNIAPEGMNIDSTGLITWYPTNDYVGNNSVVVSVTDAIGAIATQQFNITVSNTNDAPVLEPIGTLEAIEEQPFYYQVIGIDIDLGDTLSFYDDSELFDIEENTGIIFFTPSNDDVGTYTPTITVVDSSGAEDSETITFSVVDVNDPPILDPISNLRLIEDEPFTLIVTPIDIDVGDSITFYDNTTLFDIHSRTGEICLTPTNEDVGTHVVSITVVDRSGDMACQNVTFIIENVNDPPILDFISDWLLIEDDPFTLTIKASDEDLNDSIMFSDNSTLFDINQTTGVISFVPTNQDVGVHIVNITVRDKSGSIDYQTVAFVVENVNDPPSIMPIGELTALVGKDFSYTVEATDIDYGDTLTFSDDSELFDINETTGKISFTPTKKNVGEHHVTITVIDKEKESDHVTATITIQGAESETSPDYIWWILLIIVIMLEAFIIVYLMKKRTEVNMVSEPKEEEEPKEIEMELEEPMEEEKTPPPPPPEETVEFETAEEESTDNEEVD